MDVRQLYVVYLFKVRVQRSKHSVHTNEESSTHDCIFNTVFSLISYRRTTRVRISATVRKTESITTDVANSVITRESLKQRTIAFAPQRAYP